MTSSLDVCVTRHHDDVMESETVENPLDVLRLPEDHIRKKTKQNKINDSD